MQKILSKSSSHSDYLNEYTEIDIELISSRETEQETVLALLAAFGFHGFREESNRIFAYIATRDFSSEDFEGYLKQYRLNEKIKSFRSKIIPEQNWNEIWEKDYSPVQISDKCLIRAPFHLPPKGEGYDIIISPKMSFGTAHHETTRLMLKSILSVKWEKARVLDLGCGTGILAILAEKMGAGKVIAMDNDSWAWKNATENISLNNCRNIKAVHGLLETLEEELFDSIFANINLNILLQEMPNICNCLTDKGTVIFSGFYLDDLEILDQSASQEGLTLITKETLNSWTVGVYRKGH